MGYKAGVPFRKRRKITPGFAQQKGYMAVKKSLAWAGP
jgi:hypothetical protein